MKILKFPNLMQIYNFDCGAKALQAVLIYYGYYPSGSSVIKSAKTTKSGTPVKEILKTLKKYGLKYKAGRMEIETVKKYIDKKIPVITLVQAYSDKEKTDWAKSWAYGHYVVAIGYDNNKIYFEDPSSLRRTYLTYKELEERWHDKDTAGKKYLNYGIAVYDKKKSYNPMKAVHMG